MRYLFLFTLLLCVSHSYSYSQTINQSGHHNRQDITVKKTKSVKVQNAQEVNVNGDATINTAQNVIIINGKPLFSNQYKDQIIRQVYDTGKKYNCHCLSLDNINGISDPNAVADMFSYLKTRNIDLPQVNQSIGGTLFYGMKVKYFWGDDDNPSNGCIHLLVGQVLKQ